MSDAEQQLFSGGVSPEPYMDEAGRKCAEAVRFFFPYPARAEIFCGCGNNGGDALVVGRWLKEWGWEVGLNFSHGSDKLSELATRKLAQLEGASVPSSSPLRKDLILIDGLLGIGARGDLRGGILEQAKRITELRLKDFGTCFAIDIPTGLNADTGEPYSGAVEADYTLSITAAKSGFAAESATSLLGRLVEIPLDIPVEGDDSIQFLFPSNLRPRLPRRSFDTHKGAAGRVTIVAGSRGLTGAAVLAALGASRSGAGLVTVCVDEDIYPVVAAKCPAEVMVRPMTHLTEALETPHDALAIGPGLGSCPDESLVDLLLSHPLPTVVDADALNALARSQKDLSQLPPQRLLTPHPGELARLTEKQDSRVAMTRALADQWGVTLLHKGARTVVASPDHPVELNTTGHAGMASGGMGDVLTGICASLAVQGLSLHDSACVGSWLLGRAAEVARDQGHQAASSVSAVSVADCLGRALRDLETGCP